MRWWGLDDLEKGLYVKDLANLLILIVESVYCILVGNAGGNSCCGYLQVPRRPHRTLGPYEAGLSACGLFGSGGPPLFWVAVIAKYFLLIWI